MNSIQQAVILAGGRGLHLRPITDTIPKPMVSLQGRPFLEYLVELLRENGIREILMLLGYLPEKIQAHFGDGSRFGVPIQYAVTPVEYESGARLRNARKLLDDRFLLLYCDNYWPLNLSVLEQFHATQGAPATVTLYTNRWGLTRNNMFVDREGFVTRYDRRRKHPELNAVDVGFFVLERPTLDRLPNRNVSFEEGVLPSLIVERKLAGYRSEHHYVSIGSIERLPAAERFFAPRKVLFLDRDGVINRKAPEGSYIRNWNEFEFLPGVVEALERLVRAGYELYLVSNQAGVARGHMTKADVETIHTNLQSELARNGIQVRGIYYCPHHGEEGCWCRKPNPGMLLQAASEHAINLPKSIFIGDDPRDAAAGQAAGCRMILVSSERGVADALPQLL